MSLGELREEVIDLLEDELSVIAGGGTVDRVGAAIERTSELFQALGIADLLLLADRPLFRKNLALSGFARRYHLSRLRQESAATPYAAISRTTAFLDALAARHDSLAGEIVSLSPRAWIPEGEYEEDYCYYQFLHDFAPATGAADPDALAGLLDRADAVSGGGDPRIEVCRALLARDAAAFEEWFNALLQAHVAWSSDNEARLAYDPVFQLRSMLFVEGVALLDLADRVGIPVQPEYRFCPALARLDAASSWPPDLFVEVNRIAVEERAARASGEYD